MPSNPLGLMEDPIKVLVLEAISAISRDYLVKHVDVKRGRGELRVEVVLRPRREDATISVWRIVELEERIASALGVDVELSHSRVGVGSDGTLIIIYTLKSSEIAPLE